MPGRPFCVVGGRFRPALQWNTALREGGKVGRVGVFPNSRKRVSDVGVKGIKHFAQTPSLTAADERAALGGVDDARPCRCNLPLECRQERAEHRQTGDLFPVVAFKPYPPRVAHVDVTAPRALRAGGVRPSVGERKVLRDQDYRVAAHISCQVERSMRDRQTRVHLSPFADVWPEESAYPVVLVDEVRRAVEAFERQRMNRHAAYQDAAVHVASFDAIEVVCVHFGWVDGYDHVRDDVVFKERLEGGIDRYYQGFVIRRLLECGHTAVERRPRRDVYGGQTCEPAEEVPCAAATRDGRQVAPGVFEKDSRVFLQRDEFGAGAVQDVHDMSMCPLVCTRTCPHRWFMFAEHKVAHHEVGGDGLQPFGKFRSIGTQEEREIILLENIPKVEMPKRGREERGVCLDDGDVSIRAHQFLNGADVVAQREAEHNDRVSGRCAGSGGESSRLLDGVVGAVERVRASVRQDCARRRRSGACREHLHAAGVFGPDTLQGARGVRVPLR